MQKQQAELKALKSRMNDARAKESRWRKSGEHLKNRATTYQNQTIFTKTKKRRRQALEKRKTSNPKKKGTKETCRINRKTGFI